MPAAIVAPDRLMPGAIASGLREADDQRVRQVDAGQRPLAAADALGQRSRMTP